MRMVTVPPRHYCIVANPVFRDAQNLVLLDTTGQVRLRHADQEIRLAQDPFPLYPGEVLEKVPAFPPSSQTQPALPHCPPTGKQGLVEGLWRGDGYGFSPGAKLTHRLFIPTTLISVQTPDRLALSQESRMRRCL